MDIDLGNFMSIFIVVAVYVLIELIKCFITKKPELNKFIPPVSAIIGILMSLIISKIEPEYLGSSSLFTIMLTGMVSGLGATGLNQIFKQLGVKNFNLSSLLLTSSSAKEENTTESKSEDES